MRRHGWTPYYLRGSNTRWYFGFVNSNGEKVMTGGQGYSSKWSARRAAAMAMIRMGQAGPRDPIS